MKNLTIGIIGAKGKMGKEFSKLFESRGFEVLEADLNTKLSAEQVIKKADITIFSVPISSTVSLIKELAPQAKKGALLTDLTSIKSPAVHALEASAPESCEIVGLHPLFGPGVTHDMKKQVFVSCPVRVGDKASFLIQFLEQEGAVIRETTPEEHDQMMSVVQGLTHLSAIATAMALKDLGFGLKESLDISSPIYRLRLDMVGRILSQSPQLYAEIAVENPFNAQSVKAYQEAINALAKMIKKGDRKGFERSFQEAAAFLGDFKDEAYQRTSELIQRSTDIL